MGLCSCVTSGQPESNTPQTRRTSTHHPPTHRLPTHQPQTRDTSTHPPGSGFLFRRSTRRARWRRSSCCPRKRASSSAPSPPLPASKRGDGRRPLGCKCQQVSCLPLEVSSHPCLSHSRQQRIRIPLNNVPHTSKDQAMIPACSTIPSSSTTVTRPPACAHLPPPPRCARGAP